MYVERKLEFVGVGVFTLRIFIDVGEFADEQNDAPINYASIWLKV